MRPLFLLALPCLLLLTPAAAVAQNSGIDRHFGDNGLLSLRDPAQSPTNRHTGIVACAAPGGTLNVVAATNTHILSVFRIDSDGHPVRSFGMDGIATVAVPSIIDDSAHGACMADGRIVVTSTTHGAGVDRNALVLRLLPDGRLDTTFAQGGTLTLDFDQYVAGLGNEEHPLGLNLDGAGNILLSMRLFLPDGRSRPGLASLDADGVRFARMYEPAAINATYASLAGLGPNGRIWLVGTGNPVGSGVNTWFRAEIDPSTGTLLDTFVSPDLQNNVVVDGGRVLASGVMVAAAKSVPSSEPGGAYRPQLLVLRSSGASMVPLPAPAMISGQAPSMSPFPGRGVAIPIAGDRVLHLSAMGVGQAGMELATYAAVVELGATAAQDRVDTRFGQGGSTQFAYRTSTPCAFGLPPFQRPSRATNWQGRPVLTGVYAVDCQSPRQNTFVSRLLLPTDIQRDSFEE